MENNTNTINAIHTKGDNQKPYIEETQIKPWPTKYE
jgi:hypothetical protein